MSRAVAAVVNSALSFVSMVRLPIPCAADHVAREVSQAQKALFCRVVEPVHMSGTGGS
jgi:hypothetical protein